MIDWLIAKVLPDHARFEPRNVGVILCRDGECIARFLGEGPNGEIDAAVREALGIGHDYDTWVGSIRTRMTRPWDPDHLALRPVGDFRNVSIYLERVPPRMPIEGMNELLLSMSLAGALEHLFAQFVNASIGSAPITKDERGELLAFIDLQLTALIQCGPMFGGIVEQEATALTLLGVRQAILAPTRPPAIDEDAVRHLRKRHKIANSGVMSQLKDQRAFTACLADWIAIHTRRAGGAGGGIGKVMPPPLGSVTRDVAPSEGPTPAIYPHAGDNTQIG